MYSLTASVDVLLKTKWPQKVHSMWKYVSILIFYVSCLMWEIQEANIYQMFTDKINDITESDIW